jgi:hypothetical protein
MFERISKTLVLKVRYRVNVGKLGQMEYFNVNPVKEKRSHVGDLRLRPFTVPADNARVEGLSTDR